MSLHSIRRRPRRRTHAQMNVVPYIDVMLVLLVIFMVTAPMIQTGVLKLPSVGAVSQPETAPLVVQLDLNGQLNTETAGQVVVHTDASALAVWLGQHVSNNQAVVIAADKDVPYGDVMALTDALKQANIQRVGLLLGKSSAPVQP
ncbi:biopolymer transporter ExbD [Hydromonas duriensis]|uniref:Cell division and transport-associated protein TolR n=1 Tax=Hydromonas duriensis TaxID=1527608 RepID=A0A4R6YBY5_9BURK|nr:biopolymer transporter ExbD [Hydromonas duriensis]TDR33175.1 cell division and transport-associated protein TolR [Hydromonas duriensis]